MLADTRPIGAHGAPYSQHGLFPRGLKDVPTKLAPLRGAVQFEIVRQRSNLMTTNRILLTLLILPISACAVHFPVMARIDGSVYMGEAIGQLGSKGTYSLTNPKGTECHGEFENSAISLTSPATIECSDGRKGTLLILRNPNRKSGLGQGKLNDGTEVRFSYGPTSSQISLE